MAPDDGKMIAVRLEAEEVEALEKLMRIGLTKNLSEGIRMAIRMLPAGLMAQFQDKQAELARMMRGLTEDVERVSKNPNWWGGMSFEQLVTTADDPGALGEAAKEELMRRGAIWKGKEWIEPDPAGWATEPVGQVRKLAKVGNLAAKRELERRGFLFDGKEWVEPISPARPQSRTMSLAARELLRQSDAAERSKTDPRR